MNKNLLFFKVCKNSKVPAKNEFFTKKEALTKLENIDINLYNVGLPCCHNNLIILDIDIKNEGLIEFQKYIKQYGDIKTVIQKTPSGGYHYFFKEESEKYTDEEKELISNLMNKTNYRQKGLDIRKNFGYVVVEPSIINNNKYEFINHYNNNEFSEMPLTLIKWLLEYEKYNISHNLHQTLNNLIITDTQQLKYTLNMFNNNETKIWLNITAAIKNLLHKYNNFTNDELYNIWDKWSINKTNYNKNNNLKIWNTLKININFNVIIYHYNNNINKSSLILEDMKFIKSCEELTYNTDNLKILNMNNNYIYDKNYNGAQLTQDIFNNIETLIIKSTTGTGKTSNTSKFIYNYINEPANNKYKVLSIVSRRTLSQQHIISFNESNINLISYEDKTQNIENNNIVICINSLVMYASYKPEFFKNYIVYIDEISTFIRHLTHNDTLNNNLKLVYITLMKIINNCHKIILTEAVINDNVFNIIERRSKEKTLFLINEFKKYNNITAIQCNEEQIFLDAITLRVNENKPFLFGCDSCDIVTKYFNKCKLLNNDKCILITADTNFKINDANEQFKDKFVFYSPSITCGVDFNISEKQDAFLYINGKTLNPEDSFQQMTRTRNLNKVYYYINEQKKAIMPKYNNIDDCETEFINISYTHKKLCNICTNENEYNELVFNNNTFFKLFIYNEYIADIYNTNKEQHFKKMLSISGFNLVEAGAKRCTLNKETRDEFKELKKEYIEKEFTSHLEDNNNENLESIIKFLGLEHSTDEEKKNYFNIITDKILRSDYLSLIRYFQNDEIINNKLLNINKNNVEYKAIYSNYNKISLIKQLEKELNITPLEIEKIEDDIEIKINEELLKKIKVAFRVTAKEPPKTFNDFIEYYVGKLKNIFGGLNIIGSVKKQINKNRETHYFINDDIIKIYLELNYNKNPTRHNYNEILLTKFKNIMKILNEDDIFLNDSRETNKNDSIEEEIEEESALDYGIIKK